MPKIQVPTFNVECLPTLTFDQLPLPRGEFPRLTNLKLDLLEDKKKLSQTARTSQFNEPPPKSNKLFRYFVHNSLKTEEDFEKQRLKKSFKIEWYGMGDSSIEESNGPALAIASDTQPSTSMIASTSVPKLSNITNDIFAGGVGPPPPVENTQLREYYDEEWKTTDEDRNFVHLLNSAGENGDIGEKGLSFIEKEQEYDNKGFGEGEEEYEYDYGFDDEEEDIFGLDDDEGNRSTVGGHSDHQHTDYFDFVEADDDNFVEVEGDYDEGEEFEEGEYESVIDDDGGDEVFDEGDDFDDEDDEPLTPQELHSSLRRLCRGLKKKRPDLVRFIKSHNFTYDSDPEVMKMVYDDVLNEYKMDSVLFQYKLFIVVFSFGLEKMISRYSPQNSIDGFFLHQIKNMEDYELLLLELGEENNYGVIGGDTPVEIRLIFAIVMSAAGFWGIQRIGFNPIALLQNTLGGGTIDDLDPAASSGGGGGGSVNTEEQRRQRVEELRNKYKKKEE